MVVCCGMILSHLRKGSAQTRVLLGKIVTHDQQAAPAVAAVTMACMSPCRMYKPVQLPAVHVIDSWLDPGQCVQKCEAIYRAYSRAVSNPFHTLGAVRFLSCRLRTCASPAAGPQHSSAYHVCCVPSKRPSCWQCTNVPGHSGGPAVRYALSIQRFDCEGLCRRC